MESFPSFDFSYLFFDLDGTLTESAPGIIASARYALLKFGIDEKDDNALRRFIGPPLMDSFQDFYGFSTSDAKKAMAFYRERYEETGIFECSVFDGILSALKKLKTAGKRLFVATSKPEIYAKKILERFELSNFFEECIGSDLSENNSAKSLIIARALEKAGLCAGEKSAAMFGDRKHDILGAKSNHIFSFGCLWGYGSREEFLESGADFILEKPNDLPLALLN